VLVNIPARYRKWGDAAPPTGIERDGVVVYRPSQDYGPATKLLGALEYCRDRPGIKYIITVDDDFVPRTRGHIQYLLKCARALPGAAVTIGGILLDREPFRSKDGIKYDQRLRRVHAPAGFRGVVYPADALRNTVAFELMASLPEGIFHDDDAYFGCVLSVLGVPLVAVPGRPKMYEAAGAGTSAVAEHTSLHRIDNEMEIYRAAVRGGILRVPIPDPALPFRQKMAVLKAYLPFKLEQKLAPRGWTKRS